MSDINKIKKEINELMEYVINEDSYLRTKLNNKSISANEYDDIVKGIEDNKNNKLVYDILKDKMKEMEENRGKELMKKYGKLLFKDRIYKKVMGVK